MHFSPDYLGEEKKKNRGLGVKVWLCSVSSKELGYCLFNTKMLELMNCKVLLGSFFLDPKL